MPYWKACKGYMEEQFPASMGRKRQKNGGATMFSDFADMCTETMYGSLYRCTGAQDPSFPPFSLEASMRLTACVQPRRQLQQPGTAGVAGLLPCKSPAAARTCSAEFPC